MCQMKYTIKLTLQQTPYAAQRYTRFYNACIKLDANTYTP
jgi:hypothetical protein